MKIHRFSRSRYGDIKAYGYITANWFERRYLRKRIAAGDTGIYEFEGREPGPKRYRAHFCIRPKHHTQQSTYAY